jgi:putative tryptophan/tyrosine transport system substrate-binding protein
VNYGADLAGAYRQIGVYVARILKPAYLLVVQPTKSIWLSNLKAAIALNLSWPPIVLGPADEVIK